MEWNFIKKIEIDYADLEASGSTTSSSSTKTCTIINDLSSDQQSKYGDVRLVFDNWGTASKSLSKGKKLEVPCDDVIIWKGELGSNSSKKITKLASTKGKCGQTIKLSEIW